MYSRIFSFSLYFPGNPYYSYILMFSLVLQHCCYVVVCRFVRSLMAFVYQEIKGLLTYLLTYLLGATCKQTLISSPLLLFLCVHVR